MDDFYSFNAQVLGYFLPTVNETPTYTESVPLTITLAAAASVTVPLTGLTAPKLLVVKGGKGIAVKINSEAGTHDADPLFVTTNKSAGLTISALVIANTDTVAHTIVVFAAE